MAFDRDGCCDSTPTDSRLNDPELNTLPLYDSHVLDLPLIDRAILACEETEIVNGTVPIDGDVPGSADPDGIPPYTAIRADSLGKSFLAP